MTYNVFGGTLSLTQSINHSDADERKWCTLSADHKISGKEKCTKRNCDID